MNTDRFNSRRGGMRYASAKRGLPGASVSSCFESITEGGNFYSRVARAPISGVAVLVILSLTAQWMATQFGWIGCVVSRSNVALGRYNIALVDSAAGGYSHCLAMALFVCAGLLSALKPKRPRLPAISLVLMALMLVSCVCWWILGYEPSEYLHSLLAVHSPFAFMMCLGVFAGFDPAVWRYVRPLLFVLAYSSMICGIYYTSRFGFIGSYQGVTPMVDHLQISLWLGLAVVVLTQGGRWLQSALALLPIFVCIPIAVILSSRSFALLSALALAFGFVRLFKGRESLSVGKIIAVIGATAIVVVVLLFLLSLTTPERFLALEERMFDDSRSSQYAQFFDQVPVFKLILGLGPDATYTYRTQADYDYIDNQFLYVLFKWGLPVLLGYLAVVVWPGFKLLIGAARKEQRMEGMIFALWILACLGLSIFHVLLPNPQNFVIILMAGRATALLKEPITVATSSRAGSNIGRRRRNHGASMR